MIIDGFAGPGGWSEGLRMLGLTDIGLEWDDAACRTRAAAGHATIRCDVAAYPTEPFRGRIKGKLSSPPCQGWSRAGKGLSLLDQRPRTPVMASGWLHEFGILLRRYLTRPDIREPIAVHDDLWKPWTAATTGDPYAIRFGANGHAIAWAPAPDDRATGLLLAIHPHNLPQPPDWTPEGTT